jgi:hypothetical protein
MLYLRSFRYKTGPIPCDKCPAEFPTKVALRNHKEAVHPPSDTLVIICDMCSFTASTLKEYDFHCSTVHYISTPADVQIKTLAVTETASAQESYAEESGDDNYFSSNTVEDVVKQAPSAKSSSKQSSRTPVKRYKCHTCSSQFRSEKKLDEHCQTMHPDMINSVSKVHSRNLPAPGKANLFCSLCKRFFDTADEVLLHVEKDHPTVPLQKETMLDPLPLPVFSDNSRDMLICSMCDGVFSNRRLLKNHYDEAHPDAPEYKPEETVFQCCFCSFQHTRRNRVKEHEAFHTGNFPLRCEECGYGAFAKATMKRHMRKHYRPCDYQCEECGKTFNTHSGYRSHMLGHQGRGVHKCPICDQEFFTSAAKLNHVFEHAGLKPYGCHLCTDFECKDPAAMRRHLSRVHSLDIKKVAPRYHLLDFKARFRTPRMSQDAAAEEEYIVEYIDPSALDKVKFDPDINSLS